MKRLQFDGGACPNPGPCAGAFVILDEDDHVIAQGAEFIPHGTNNVGEYTGVILGLERCLAMGISTILVEGDSMLVISQLAGKWKIKHANMIPLYEKAHALARQFTEIHFTHIRREYNKRADALSDESIRLHSSL